MECHGDVVMISYHGMEHQKLNMKTNDHMVSQLKVVKSLKHDRLAR